MNKFNMNAWKESIIANKDICAIPIMTHPGIEIIGKTVKEAVTDGGIHYEAIKALHDKYPSAASTVIMDLTVEAEAFGAEIVFQQGEVPSVIGRLLINESDIDSLIVPDIKEGRLKEYLKANLLAVNNLVDRPVLAGCIGPFSLAGRLYDISEIMILIYTNPSSAHILLGKCRDFILKYCLALKEIGVNGVIMAEPVAGLLSDEDCMKFSSYYIKEIIDEVQDEYFSVVLHNCGNTGNCTSAMMFTQAAAYHFGNNIDMLDVLENIPSDSLVMGNIDPVSILKMGNPRLVKSEVAKLLYSVKEYPNFVLSSGCDIPPSTPIGNINAFFEALDEFNRMKAKY